MQRFLILAVLFAAAPAFAQLTDSIIDTQKTLTSPDEKMQVTLIGIDGESVDSGSSMWSDDENLQYKLSPGAHTIKLRIVTGPATGDKDAPIYVTPGRHYRLGAQTVTNPQTGEPQSYIAFIQDDIGNRVWADNYYVTTTIEMGKSPWAK